MYQDPYGQQWDQYGKSNIPPKKHGVVATATSYKAAAPCHTNHHPIFTAHGVTFHLGKYAAVGEQKHDLVLDLADGVKAGVQLLNGTPGLQAFAAKYATAVMKISWPDMGIPTWGKQVWLDLLDAITNDDQISSVYICCMGGHGRTGTAAAIIGCLLGTIPEEECPVLWLRSNYCDSVVESQSQLDYITKITGRTVKAEASKASWSYSDNHTKGKALPGSQHTYYAESELSGEFFDPKANGPVTPKFKNMVLN